MSRVHEALKRANALRSPAETGVRPEVLEVGAKPEDSAQVPAAADFAKAAATPECGSSNSGYRALLRYRWVRKMLRLAGFAPRISVQKCQGTTRMGQPCRGPAMANGYCRLHGGSRHGAVAQKTRELIGRVLPAR
jgi:hypothetical protein